MDLAKTNYPMEVNGWIYTLDTDNMSYYKLFLDGHTEALALCWLDTVEGEDGYNPEGDCYVCIWAENTDYESALDSLEYSNMTFGNVMRRTEAEKYLIDYMNKH